MVVVVVVLDDMCLVSRYGVKVLPYLEGTLKAKF